ncbi:HlyD family type I secretion periplasmic adaptor subunit [Gellertiella hungarica]|uniref:Membrane fusion protein (MFP) family protein n=1 Tax=Gellertiella hungarica TaxID=1572859 RepID=A0A7W6J9W8_9HYPH|nr:HlyD family type I secretion periplasmic adaptor subunit [Gellertiella hungarica]MBB4066561.1 adhesin transport system membrane fusion protein [Gellertiella hungarica]
MLQSLYNRRRKGAALFGSDSVEPDRAPHVLYAICAAFTAFVIWAAFAELDEISRGVGKVIPVSKTQIVQSSEPGVVQEINVQVGQVVKKGELLIRLDKAITASSLGEARAKSRSLTAQIARLDLEQKGDFKIAYVCPDDILKNAPAICDNEASLYRARADNFLTKASVLESRYQQRLKEINEATENIARLKKNLEITQQEENLLQPIVKRKLAAQTDLLKVQKELADTTGQISLYNETLARLQSAAKEARLEMDELKLESQQEALAAKTEALAQLSILEETIKGAESRVVNTEIRSPVDGIVNTLEVNTVGAYVNAGGVVAGIVPTSDKLLIEARLSPNDVAFVRPGQPAMIKITAYDFTIYGGLTGTVANVSADSLVDQQTGDTFYQVRVKTDKAALEKDGHSYPISPGMVASVDIMTGKKTVLAYLLKPLIKARQEALRER